MMTNGKYAARFVMDAERVAIKCKPGWYMRQFTDDEDAEARSAARIGEDKIRNNPRFKRIGDVEAEARRHGQAEYVRYILPLLLEDKEGNPIFDIHSEQSLKEFDNLTMEVFRELREVFWGKIFSAWEQAKNLSAPESGSKSRPARSSGPGPSKTHPIASPQPKPPS